MNSPSSVVRKSTWPGGVTAAAHSARALAGTGRQNRQDDKVSAAEATQDKVSIGNRTLNCSISYRLPRQ